jgi:dinuclear metal center YbgI/SA1388 family protein
MLVKNIIEQIENQAPIALQESYDNSGLQIGKLDSDVNKALICIDITPAVMQEAIVNGCDMIISHHPLIFEGLKKISGRNAIEQMVELAIKHNILIYSAHTHLDNIKSGVNGMLAEKLGLTHLKILRSKQNILRKLITFCPEAEAEKVRKAIFDAGAGHIGNYDCCSYNIQGQGTFRANEKANPFVGKIGEMHTEKEVRIETIYPFYHEKEIINALKNSHPYEEVAYDIYPLHNDFQQVGSGMLGELKEKTDASSFLKTIMDTLQIPILKYSGNIHKEIKKVAVCGGSGAFLIKDALNCQADIFITSDIKYHQFGDYSEKLILVDAGHFETEQFTKHLICDILNKKFPTFATRISEQDNNLVKYYM